MWCGWNRCGDSVNRHCLLLFRGLGALAPLPLIILSLLAITFLLLLSLHWLLALLVVMVIQLLCQSFCTVICFGVCSYDVSPQMNRSIFFPSEVIIPGHNRDSSLNLDM